LGLLKNIQHLTSNFEGNGKDGKGRKAWDVEDEWWQVRRDEGGRDDSIGKAEMVGREILTARNAENTKRGEKVLTADEARMNAAGKGSKGELRRCGVYDVGHHPNIQYPIAKGGILRGGVRGKG